MTANMTAKCSNKRQRLHYNDLNRKRRESFMLHLLQITAWDDYITMSCDKRWWLCEIIILH